ncbi:MAG: phage tail protein [Proteocatella sp.]
MQSSKGSGGIPVGTVIIWASATFPINNGIWLECNGQSTENYSELAKIVGTNVPDYRGIFLRGYGSQAYAQNNGSIIGVTSTTYSSESLGTIQGDSIREIYASFGGAYSQSPNTQFTGAIQYSSYAGGFEGSSEGPSYLWRSDFKASKVLPVSNEIRPINKSVYYLIKAK